MKTKPNSVALALWIPGVLFWLLASFGGSTLLLSGLLGYEEPVAYPAFLVGAIGSAFVTPVIYLLGGFDDEKPEPATEPQEPELETN